MACRDCAYWREGEPADLVWEGAGSCMNEWLQKVLRDTYHLRASKGPFLTHGTFATQWCPTPLKGMPVCTL